MKRCLLAESDAQRRTQVRGVLGELGFDVLEAAGVERTLDCIHDHQPAFVMFSPDFPNEDWRKIIGATINNAPKAKIVVYGAPQHAAAVAEAATLGANCTMPYSAVSKSYVDLALHELELV